jgi:nicotinate-nucleotide adenylyltransferase
LPFPSYTAVTLAKLTELYPDHQFEILMGEDNLQNLYKWRNYEYILEHFQIIVYPRPGSQGGELKNHPHVKYINAPMMEISATQIREAIKNRKKIQYLLPEKVKQYIEDMGVYRK